MRILFQGDSVTDAGRNREDPHDLGNGYPKYAAEKLAALFPDREFEFLNLGISGNRSDQLFDRLYPDAIAYDPDLVSVLIGINDIWHRRGANKIETTEEQIEANLCAILRRLRAQTHAKIVLLSPFLLDCADKDVMRGELDAVLGIVRRLAPDHADLYIPLDQLFLPALETQPEPQYYSADGIHPNQNGAKLIGSFYAEAVKTLID